MLIDSRTGIMAALCPYRPTQRHVLVCFRTIARHLASQIYGASIIRQPRRNAANASVFPLGRSAKQISANIDVNVNNTPNATPTLHLCGVRTPPCWRFDAENATEDGPSTNVQQNFGIGCWRAMPRAIRPSSAAKCFNGGRFEQ